MENRDCIVFAAMLNMLYGYRIVCIEDGERLLYAYCIGEENGKKIFVDERGIEEDAKEFFDELDSNVLYKDGTLYENGKELSVRICGNPDEAFDRYVFGDWYDGKIKDFIMENECLYKCTRASEK